MVQGSGGARGLSEGGHVGDPGCGAPPENVSKIFVEKSRKKAIFPLKFQKIAQLLVFLHISDNFAEIKRKFSKLSGNFLFPGVENERMSL